MFLGCLNVEIVTSGSNGCFLLPKPHPFIGHRSCKGNQSHPGWVHTVSLNQEGQSHIPGNTKELWLCLGHGSVLTQKGHCLSGTGVFLCGSQLVSLEWTWLSRGCRTVRAAGLQLAIPLTWHVCDRETGCFSVPRRSLSEGHCSSLQPSVPPPPFSVSIVLYTLST